jgi:hypothetical protein
MCVSIMSLIVTYVAISGSTEYLQVQIYGIIVLKSMITEGRGAQIIEGY